MRNSESHGPFLVTFLGSMTFAVDLRQLSKVVFLMEFRLIPNCNFGNSQKSNFVNDQTTIKEQFLLIVTDLFANY